MKRTYSYLIAVGLVVAVALRIAIAADAPSAAPEQYKVVFENDKVRVLRVTYAPGASAAMHEHPDAVVVQLTGGDLSMTLSDGSTIEPENVAGTAGWSPAGMHSVTNTGFGTFDAWIIELKN